MRRAYIALIVSQDPWEDGVLHEVVVRPTGQGVQLHEVLEVGHLSVLVERRTRGGEEGWGSEEKRE